MSVAVVPYIPDTAPFSTEQRAWLNGYLAGLFSRTHTAANGTPPPVVSAATARGTVTILYGSQTGTAEGIARETAEKVTSAGWQATVCDLSEYDLARLPAEERLLIVCSTYGDGDMPDNVQPFWEQLCRADAPRLDKTRFTLLALGDTNYETFCQAGKNLDRRLQELGATCLYPRVDCDVDYEAAFRRWVEGCLPALSSNGHAPSAVATTTEAAVMTSVSTTSSRKHPFPARLLKNIALTALHSSKETRHYEIALADSGMTYTVGDALGIIPRNCPELVQELVEALGCSGEEAVPGTDAEDVSLYQALVQHYDIQSPSRDLLEFFAQRSGDSELQALVQAHNKTALETYIGGRHSIDFLRLFPQVKPTPQEFVGLLKKLQARAYSISSSLKAHPGEVHLTVATVRYTSHDRNRKGVCSTFLADRVGNGSAIPVFVLPNKYFGVPQDPTRPMIMVGPGTGVAPFRAFLEERRAMGALGKNWLFFGERNQATDFFYAEQFLAYQREGFLTRLDLAFSRDQQAKLYVQHRMLENSQALYAWLQEGAYFFVCGDMHHMARDVDAALHAVIKRESGCSSEQAMTYVTQMKQDKRYARDVY